MGPDPGSRVERPLSPAAPLGNRHDRPCRSSPSPAADPERLEELAQPCELSVEVGAGLDREDREAAPLERAAECAVARPHRGIAVHRPVSARGVVYDPAGRGPSTRPARGH